MHLRREVLRLTTPATPGAWSTAGDGLSGLVVDRYDDLLVVEYFSAGMFRHREWIHDALRAQFPGCRFHALADEHVQKQESFDFRETAGTEPAVITEHGVRFRADPAGAHKTGFFADQRDNREWLSHRCAGKRVLDLCCNTGGFGIYAAVRGAAEVVGIDIDEAVLEIARGNARLNNVRPRFVQADIFPWLRDAAANRERFDVVVLDPAKMTRDREQVIRRSRVPDMNKLALGVVSRWPVRHLLLHRPGGRGAVPGHAAPRRVLRRAHGAGAEGGRRRRRPSVPGPRARVALPEGGVLPRAGLNHRSAGPRRGARRRHRAGPRRGRVRHRAVGATGPPVRIVP